MRLLRKPASLCSLSMANGESIDTESAKVKLLTLSWQKHVQDALEPWHETSNARCV